MKRVQMRRGVKLPPNTKSVARPSRWGNPFRTGDRHCPECRRPMDRAEVVALYHDWLLVELIADPAFLEPLRGFDLACWCPVDDGQPCHADVLLEMLDDG